MQTKLLAGIKKNIFPEYINVRRADLSLRREYIYSDNTVEYAILKNGAAIGHIGWRLTDVESKLVEIDIHNVADMLAIGRTDETGEGIGTVVVQAMLELSAALRRQNFVIWNTRNYALLHLAQKFGREEIRYALLDDNGDRQGEVFTWPWLLSGLYKLNCKFLAHGFFQEKIFVKAENNFWRSEKENNQYRLEFAENDRINIYYENTLIPKADISIIGSKFDIIIPVNK